ALPRARTYRVRSGARLFARDGPVRVCRPKPGPAWVDAAGAGRGHCGNLHVRPDNAAAASSLADHAGTGGQPPQLPADLLERVGAVRRLRDRAGPALLERLER